MSLISLLKKGRYLYMDPQLPTIREQILDPRTVKVNVTGVMRDIVETHETSTDVFVDFQRIPPAVPPFPMMWLEGRYENSQSSYGYLLDRRTVSEISVSVCLEHEAQCGLNLFWFALHLDADGRLDGITHSLPEADHNEGHRLLLVVSVLSVLLSLARMNCRNVSLRPTTSSKQQGKRESASTSKPPTTVWHEIVINSLPKSKGTSNRRAWGSDESIIRLHRVRGHFEDYTRGKGLFGRIKGVFWMPDHEQGSKAAGEVISSYRLESGRSKRGAAFEREGLGEAAGKARDPHSPTGPTTTSCR
jgi:hypothetical protein